jgi:hypothetical protein
MDKGYPILNKINYHSHGIERYQSFFEHCGHKNATVFLEATPHYLYQQTAIEVLPTLRPLPKIIFIFRKPSNRVYSLYRFTQNNLAVLDKNVTFDKFVSLLKANSKGMFKDRVLLRNAIEHSKYSRYISRWIERFGAENIRAFLFEHLKNSPVGLMKDVSDYIGIDASFWDRYVFAAKNVTYQVRSQRLHKLKKMLGSLTPGVIRKGIKRIYTRSNIERKTGKSGIDAKALDLLEREFLPYNEELADLLDINITAWK